MDAVSAGDRIALGSLMPCGWLAPGSEAVTGEKSKPQQNSGLLDIENKELQGFRGGDQRLPSREDRNRHQTTAVLFGTERDRRVTGIMSMRMMDI